MNLHPGCKYGDVIATAEKASGNESVGTMWVETKSFFRDTPVHEIIQWARDIECNGKLILTIDSGTLMEEK